MKIGIYSPYFSMMGGGERYILSIACALQDKHEVTIFDSSEVKEKAKKIFNLSLDKVKFIESTMFKNRLMAKDYFKLSHFDIFFYMTDGSVFLSPAKKNFLIIQSPSHIPVISMINRIKLFNWKILCYSDFMKDIIKKRTKKNPVILSPGIDTEKFVSKKSDKQDIILTVGRFFKSLHNKKHEFLLDVFLKNYKNKFPGYKLVIAGGFTESSGQELIKDLKEKSKGYPVEIIVNVSFDKLVELYRSAKIYWHGAGYGCDLENHPEMAEHFGITTLEAMSCGCVSVVFDGGGQKDIVNDKKDGYLWKESGELIDFTSELIKDEKKRQEMEGNALKKAQDYSYQKFNENLYKIIGI